MFIPPQLPRAPFAAITGAFCGGLLLCFRAGASASAGLGLLLGGAVLWILLEWRRVRFTMRDLTWLPVILCFCGTGILTASINLPMDVQEIPDGYLARGIVRESAGTESGSRLTVEVTSLTPRRSGEERRLHTKLLLYTDSVPLTAGDRITFPAIFTPASGEPAYLSYLFSRGIDFTQSCPSRLIAHTGHERSLLTLAGDARLRIVERLNESALKTDTKVFMAALLTGLRSDMTRETRAAFTAAGIAHVLAVSGLHVGIVVLILALLLRPLDYINGRRLRYLLTIAGIWCFALLAGLGAPVVRAAVMASCVIIAILLQRPRLALNSLCLAAFLILLVDPRALFDAGFLLSFCVTGGILFLVSGLTPARERMHPWLHNATLWIAVPCVAFLSSWMLTARFFHSVQLWFLPVNLLLAPLLPFYFGIGVLYILLLFAGVDCSLCATLLDGGYAALMHCATWAGNLPGSHVSLYINELPIWFYMGALICFALYLSFGGKWKLLSALGGVVASGLLIMLAPAPVPPDTLELGRGASRCLLRSTRRGEPEKMELPRGSLSCAELQGHTIIFLDSAMSSSPAREPLHCDWLIIGSRYQGTLAEAYRQFTPDSLVWHQSVSPSRREEMEAEFKAAGERHPQL